MLSDYYTDLDCYLAAAREGRPIVIEPRSMEVDTEPPDAATENGALAGRPSWPNWPTTVVAPPPLPPPPPRPRDAAIPLNAIRSLSKSSRWYFMADDQPTHLPPGMVELHGPSYRGMYLARCVGSADLKPYLEVERDIHTGLCCELDWPGSPRVHDVAKLGETYFVVLDKWVDPTLAEVLADRAANRLPPLPEETALLFLLEMASVVCYLHNSGIAHLGLCADRFHVRRGPDRRLRIALTSFETARKIDGPVLIAPGTMRYPPPELARDANRADPIAIDSYAIGGCLYDILTNGQPPPPSDDDDDSVDMDSDSSENDEAARRRIDVYHPALKATPRATKFLRALVAPNPKHRTTASELRTDLLKLLGRSPLPFVPDYRPPITDAKPTSTAGRLLQRIGLD